MTNKVTAAREAASKVDLPPVHPGEILKEEFLDPYDLSQYELARRTGMPAQRVGQIVLGKRHVSAESELRFGPFFDTSPEFRLKLQSRYELEVTASRNGEAIKSSTKVRAKELAAAARPNSPVNSL